MNRKPVRLSLYNKITLRVVWWDTHISIHFNLKTSEGEDFNAIDWQIMIGKHTLSTKTILEISVRLSDQSENVA